MKDSFPTFETIMYYVGCSFVLFAGAVVWFHMVPQIFAVMLNWF